MHRCVLVLSMVGMHNVPVDGVPVVGNDLLAQIVSYERSSSVERNHSLVKPDVIVIVVCDSRILPHQTST